MAFVLVVLVNSLRPLLAVFKHLFEFTKKAFAVIRHGDTEVV